MSNCSFRFGIFSSLIRSRAKHKIVEEVAGHVARVDRLDHDVEAMRREELGGVGHRFAERRDRPGIAAVGDARHQMHALDAGRFGIGQRGVQALLQIVETIRQRGKSLFAGVPIARRQVEQRLRQAVALEPLADRVRRMLIGKQEFDRGESRFGRRIEAVEERHFGEHHGEIGGETGHRLSSCLALFGHDVISVRPADACRSPWHTSAPPRRRHRGPCRKPPSSGTSAARPPRPAPEISRCAPCPG